MKKATTATQRESWLKTRVQRIAVQLRYELVAPLPHGMGSMCLDFFRNGRNFNSELLSFLYFRHPRRTLLVDFVGSPFSASELRAKGLARNSITESLSEYQYRRGKTPASVLPEEIFLDSLEEWEAIFHRIESEILEVEPEIWVSLAQRWTEITGTLPA